MERKMITEKYTEGARDAQMTPDFQKHAARRYNKKQEDVCKALI